MLLWRVHLTFIVQRNHELLYLGRSERLWIVSRWSVLLCAADTSDPAWHPDKRSYHRGPAPVTPGINTPRHHLRSEALNITIKWCKIRFWWCSVLECDWMIKLVHILIMIIMIITSSFIDPGRSSRLHPPCTGTHRPIPEWKPWQRAFIFHFHLFFCSLKKSECLFCVMEASSDTNIKSKSRPINPLGGLSDHHHLPWKFMFIRWKRRWSDLNL